MGQCGPWSQLAATAGGPIEKYSSYPTDPECRPSLTPSSESPSPGQAQASLGESGDRWSGPAAILQWAPWGLANRCRSKIECTFFLAVRAKNCPKSRVRRDSEKASQPLLIEPPILIYSSGILDGCTLLSYYSTTIIVDEYIVCNHMSVKVRDWLHKETFILADSLVTLGHCTELSVLWRLQYVYELDSRVYYWNRILFPEVLDETLYYCDTDHIICREIEFNIENKDLDQFLRSRFIVHRGPVWGTNYLQRD